MNIRLSVDGDGQLIVLDGGSQGVGSSSDVMTEEIGVPSFTDADAPSTRSMTFSTGQSFYVPWDKTYLNQFQHYITVAIGSIVVVAALAFALKFGIGFVASIINNFTSGR